MVIPKAGAAHMSTHLLLETMSILRLPLLVLLLCSVASAWGQGAEPYVDHWDAKKTIKRNGWGVPGLSWMPGEVPDPFGH